MHNKLASEEDLKYFQTSLCSNEEDVKGLLNIKKEAFKEINLLPEDVFVSALIASYMLSPYSRIWFL